MRRPALERPMVGWSQLFGVRRWRAHRTCGAARTVLSQGSRSERRGDPPRGKSRQILAAHPRRSHSIYFAYITNSISFLHLANRNFSIGRGIGSLDSSRRPVRRLLATIDDHLESHWPSSPSLRAPGRAWFPVAGAVLRTGAIPMDEPLLRVALFVAVTNGFRALGLVTGPRWGLLLGLPCTSARDPLFLRFSVWGWIRRSGGRVGPSGGRRGGRVAPWSMRVIGRAGRLPCGVAASVACYFVMAWGSAAWARSSRLESPGRGAGRRRHPRVVGADPEPSGSALGSRGQDCRPGPLLGAAHCGRAGVVPARRDGLQGSLGGDWAGLLDRSPGISLAVLVLVDLERAGRGHPDVAGALPPGECEHDRVPRGLRRPQARYGLGWGTAGGVCGGGGHLCGRRAGP